MVVLFILLDLGGLSRFVKVSELSTVGLGALGTFSFTVSSRALKGLIMILFGDRFLIKVYVIQIKY